MAALLVAMAVMAILASAAMPVWKQMAQREKEAELIFRGQQYARAIGLFQRRAGPGVNPPNLDLLVEQRFLRKKYKDPITGEDFVPISAASNAASTPGSLPAGSSPAGRGQRGQTPASAGRGSRGVSAPIGGAQGGIIGVASKSTEKSIRIYNGRSHYNEWAFVYVPQVQAPGGAAGPGRGQRGGPQGQPPRPGGIGGVGGRGGSTEIRRGTDGRPEIIRGGPPPIPGRGTPPPPQRPPGD